MDYGVEGMKWGEHKEKEPRTVANTFKRGTKFTLATPDGKDLQYVVTGQGKVRGEDCVYFKRPGNSHVSTARSSWIESKIGNGGITLD